MFQICNEPYFYNKITEQEAEEMLSSMVKPGSFVAQFGSMDDSKSFQTINELVSHFQVTPIPFDEDSPDLVLTHPWNKSEV